MNNTFEEIWEVLMKAEKILIPLHKSPDPDSLGSAVASACVLRNLDKNVRVVSVDPVPNIPILTELFPVEQIDPSDMEITEFDIFLAQDIAGINRYSNNEGFSVPSSVTIVNIDHHKTNPFFGTYNLVDTTAPATAEILFNLFETVKIAIDAHVATALFCGLMSDSGWFAFDPHERTYDVAKACVGLGVDTRVVSAQLSRTTIGEVKIQGLVASRITEDPLLHFAYSYLTLKDIAEAGMQDTAYYNGVHVFKHIESIDFGILITEKKQGYYKCSLRTREAHDYDVAQLAVATAGVEKGGGHTMAAGFEIEANSVEEVLDRVREVVKELAISS